MKAWFASLKWWFSIEAFQIGRSGIGFLLVALSVPALLYVLLGRGEDSIRHRKTVPVIATIKSFGLGGRFYPGLTRVRAQDDKGLTGVAAVPGYRLLGCNVGDKIRADRAGITLMLEPAPCPITLLPGEGAVVRAK